MNRYLLFSLLLLASAVVRADFDPYYSDRHHGWFYHEDPPAPTPKRAPEPVKPAPPPPAAPAKPAEPAPLSVAWIKQNLEQAKIRAIDDPSRENLEAYFAIQRVYFDKSSKFASAYQDALKVSAFDENTNWSAAQFGQQAAAQAVTDSQGRLMKQVAKVAGLWMFYRADCSYCKAEVPVLLNLQDVYGIKTLPVAMDTRVVWWTIDNDRH